MSQGLPPTHTIHGWEQGTGGEHPAAGTDGHDPAQLSSKGRQLSLGQPLQVLLAPKPSTAPLTAWTTPGLCFVSPESEQLKAEFGSAGMGHHLPSTETMPSLDGDAAAWSHTRHEAVS